MSPERRPAAVAGRYYPAQPDELRAAVARLLDPPTAAPAPTGPAPTAPAPGPAPKAVIAPHAGYAWCGPVLGPTARTLAAGRGRVTRVVVVGPAHRAPLDGLALSGAAAWATPLGDVEVDRAATARLAALPAVAVDDGVHGSEHAIEVLLPVLRAVLGPVAVVPVLVGRAAVATVARVLDAAWGGGETAVVVSSDLAHGLDEAATRRRDAATVRAVVEGRAADLGPGDACGWRAVAGLVTAAARRGLTARPVATGTSADTVGDPRRAVGYAGLAFRPLLPLGRRDLTALHRAAVLAVGPRAGGGPDRSLEDLERAVDPPEAVRGPGASFVRLTVDGAPHGCRGTVEPRRPLWHDVVRNARRAAFEDRRFPPVVGDLWDRATVGVAVLSPLAEVAAGSPGALSAALVPGADGLVISSGGHGAVVLPHVWHRHPGADDFVAALVAKAGWAGPWPAGALAWRFRTQETGDAPAAAP